MSASKSKSGTLVADTVATVTINGDFDELTVVNRDGAAELWFVYDWNATPSDPTVAGDDAISVPTVGSVTERFGSLSGATTSVVVKLISSGTPTYSVEAR